MKPLFEFPELLTLSGENFTGDFSLIANGVGCHTGCLSGCCGGCNDGGGSGIKVEEPIW